MGYRENLIKLGYSKNNIRWDPSIKSKRYSSSGWYYDQDNNGKFDPYKDLYQGKSNTQYIVKSGDNLSSIAKSHNTNINTLLKLNPQIKTPNSIGINSIIKLPIPIININNNGNNNFNNYQVKSGDTLFKIATNNNTTVQEILKNNSGLNPNLIKPGQSIKLVKRNIYKPKIQNWKDIQNYENNINKLQGADLINTFKQQRPTGTPYIIDDKKNGKLNVYIDGKLIKSFNALHGANGRASKEQLAKWKQLNIAEEDDYTKTYVDKNGKIRNGAGNMSTPAGIFYTDSSGTYHNAPSFMRRDIDMINSNNPNGIASSIHYRDMAGSNVTNGCTGMSAKDLNSLAQILKGYKHVETYILPDNPNNGKFFIRNGKINFSSNRRTMQQNGIAKGFRSNINIKFDGIDNTGQSYGSDRINKTNRFISGLTKYKKQLMSDLGINDDTYNNLSLASLGILGRETSYGNTHNAIGNFGRAIGKFFNHNSSSPDYISKYSIYGANQDNNSIGLTQMRISQLDKHSRELLNKYHITKDDLVYNPEKAAIATMIKLGQEYRNQGLNIDKAIASWNNRPGYVNSVKQLINNDFNLYTNY